jgi:hypothetical protein
LLWVAHTSGFLRCIRTVRTHDKLRHVCATQSTGTRPNRVILVVCAFAEDDENDILEDL